MVVEADCAKSESITGVMSCTVSGKVRVISSGGHKASVHQLVEIGAGASIRQALSRAASLVVERHPELFHGL